MKPLPIADYLDRLGRASSEKEPLRKEGLPFRPRSLAGARDGEARPNPAFDRLFKPVGSDPQGAPLDRKPIPLEAASRQMQAPRDATKPQDTAAKLAEAYGRGRQEGLAEGRAEAAECHAAELAAAQRQELTRRLELQRNEYTQLEGAIRSGFAQLEANVGAAVTRILAPFLAKQAANHVADELSKSIARLCAGGSPGLITIRGPEHILAPLRQRIADLPADVDYVEDQGAEAIVEANATRIVTELRPWAELLASFDA